MNSRSSSLLVLLSAIFFATGGLFYKVASWNSLAICTFRSLLALVLIIGFLIVTKHKFVINKTVIFAAIGNASTSVLYSMANKMTTAGNTIVLQFTMPIYVIVLSSIINRTKPNKLEATTCFFVLLGIVLFFVDSLTAGNMLGNILALVSGVTYALFFIFNSKEDADPLSTLAISLFLSAMVGMSEFVKTDFVNTNTTTWLAVIGLGVIQQALGHGCLAIGIKGTSAVTASLLSGLEPVLNPILVAIFYKELLTPLSLIGAIIVLASIITYNVIDSKQKEAS